MSHVYVGRTNFATDVLPVDFPVVLKVMSDELAGDITARKRFIKEAQILSKLRHRYITRFYEFINNDAGAVLVMEYVEGTPVDCSSRNAARCRSNDAIVVCQCMLEALVYAHGKGIVHRDIKPANLIKEKSAARSRSPTSASPRSRKGAGTSGQTVLTKSGLPPRHAALHVARADPRAEGCRREERHLLLGRRALRDAHRRAAVQQPLAAEADRRHLSRREAGAAARCGPRSMRSSRQIVLKAMQPAHGPALRDGARVLRGARGVQRPAADRADRRANRWPSTAAPRCAMPAVAEHRGTGRS